VWGDQDAIIPIEHAYAAHAAIPGSRLEVFEGCGHFPHVEDPQRLVAAIRDFVNTTEPPAGGRERFKQILADA
jgi:pimeloyl-ACP methyl ester carboxylesterase